MLITQVSKWIILIVILLCFSTAIQDPLNRELIYIEEDQKHWCIIHFKNRPWLQRLDSILNLVHFITPFLINFCASFIIILLTARVRSSVGQKTFLAILRKQFEEHHHLIITPCLLVILALPRIIISSQSSCIMSPNNPRLPLAVYFVSFIPTVLNFIIFVVPSKRYRSDFKQVINYLVRTVRKK